MTNQPEMTPLCRQINALLASGQFEQNMAVRLGRSPDEFPRIRESLTQIALDSFTRAFARDATVAEYLTAIVANAAGVEEFWNAFALLVLAYGTAQRALALEERFGAASRQAAKPSTLAILADILVEADCHGVAKRIDDVAGVPATNVLTLYSMAFVLHRHPRLWSDFLAAAGEVSQA